MSFSSSSFPGTSSPGLPGQEKIAMGSVCPELLRFTWGPGSSSSDLFDQPHFCDRRQMELRGGTEMIKSRLAQE